MLISRFAHLEARSHAYRERVPGDYVTGTYACMPRRARQGLEGEGKVGAVSPFGRLKASLSPLTSKRGPSHCLRCQFDHPSRFLQRVDKQVFFGAREKDMVSTRCMLPLARVQSKRLMMVGKIRHRLQFAYSCNSKLRLSLASKSHYPRSLQATSSWNPIEGEKVKNKRFQICIDWWSGHLISRGKVASMLSYLDF